MPGGTGPSGRPISKDSSPVLQAKQWNEMTVHLLHSNSVNFLIRQNGKPLGVTSFTGGNKSSDCSPTEVFVLIVFFFFLKIKEKGGFCVDLLVSHK